MGEVKVLLNLHAVIDSSRVNGPGERLVVFFQGCRRDCRGCFNPGTHPVEERILSTVEEIFLKHLPSTAEGMTISGGEPFLQHDGLYNLLKAARTSYGVSTIVYTGYTFEEVSSDPLLARCLEHTDVLIDGGYEEEKKETTLLARGSTNQRFHFLTGRYAMLDFHMPGRAEVVIRKDGTVTGTGFSRMLFPGK
ncbi:MAG: radical SAM protein [Deltaproteobacteria bacterium]|nr:radical SAM protein [Deltaproteobacteria bacterium]